MRVALALSTFLLCTPTALAGIPIEAQTAMATARAFLKAQRPRDALDAVSTAVQAAPGWLDARYLRIKVQLQLAGPGSSLAELSKPPQKDRDYAAMARYLAGAAADLSAVLATFKDDDPARDRVLTSIGSLRARAKAAEDAAAALRAATSPPPPNAPTPTPVQPPLPPPPPTVVSPPAPPPTSLAPPGAGPVLPPERGEVRHGYAGIVLRPLFCTSGCETQVTTIGVEFGGRVVGFGLRYGYQGAGSVLSADLRFGYEIELPLRFGIVPFLELSPFVGFGDGRTFLEVVVRPGFRVVYRPIPAMAVFFEPFALDIGVFRAIFADANTTSTATLTRFQLGFGVQARF